MESLPSTILTGQSGGSTLNGSQTIEDFIEENARPLLYPAIRPIKPLSESSYEYHRAGTGEVSGLGCGVVKFFTACTAKTLEHRIFSKKAVHARCTSLLCPICYEGASRRSSKRIEARLNGLHAKYLQKGIRLGKPKHIEFSPSLEHWNMEYFLADGGKRAFSEVVALLDEFAQDGVYGGDLTLHLERRKHKDGSECHLKKCDRRHVWVWGPHFHYFGFGFLANSDYFHSRSGWIYKRIQDSGPRDIQATAFYILTHSALFVNQKTGRSAKNHRYVGLFQDKLAKRIDLGTRQEPCICPECKVPLHRFAKTLGSPDEIAWDNDQGEAFHTVQVVDWVLREKQPKVKPLKVEAKNPPPPVSKILPREEVHESCEAYDYDLKQWLGFNVDSDQHKEYLRRKKEIENQKVKE